MEKIKTIMESYGLKAEEEVKEYPLEIDPYEFFYGDYPGATYKTKCTVYFAGGFCEEQVMCLCKLPKHARLKAKALNRCLSKITRGKYGI